MCLVLDSLLSFSLPCVLPSWLSVGWSLEVVRSKDHDCSCVACTGISLALHIYVVCYGSLSIELLNFNTWNTSFPGKRWAVNSLFGRVCISSSCWPFVWEEGIACASASIHSNPIMWVGGLLTSELVEGNPSTSSADGLWFTAFSVNLNTITECACCRCMTEVYV